MARKRASDDRQEDFFGAPVPAEPARPADKPPAARPAADGAPNRARRPPPEEGGPGHDDLGTRIARSSSLDLRDLVAGLPDEALGQLTVAAIRQLRRRLTRDARGGGKRRTPALDRAMQELVALFAEQGDDEYDF